MDFNSKNVLSDEKHFEECLKPFVPEEFHIDLQLFGGGGGGGKRAAKAILTIGAFFVGAGHVGMAFFGTSSSIAGGIMGMSLFSSVWALGSKKNSAGGNGSPSVMRFDREQEAMSLGGVIPVVYGRRMITGNQTFHETDADANNLHKHVVLCEGGIEGIETLTAQGFSIATNGTSEGLGVMAIQNLKYEDARVATDDKTLVLYADGKTKTIALKNDADMKGDSGGYGQTFYAWQLEVGSLVAYINRLGNGWEAFPLATTSRYCGDLVIGSYVGKRTFRKDGGDPHPARFNSGNMICMVIPGTYRREMHWHHLRKRPAHYVTCDCFIAEPQQCYKKQVPMLTPSCTGVTSVAYHDGDLPDNYQTVGSYNHMAWLDLQFTVSDNLGGNPNIEALVKGRKVYDTRKKRWAYSTNPAMCLRDLLLNKTYGAGNWISEDDLDEDSFMEAADWCDAYVRYKLVDGTVVDTHRYELNLVMDNRQSVWEWAQSILATFCGYLVLSRNKLHLRIEKATSVSYKFDESSIKDLAMSQTSLEDCPNQYKLKFVDPLNNWKTATIVLDNASSQREQQRVISKDVELEGVTSQAQALRLARFYRDYNEICTLQVEFKTGYEAVHLEPGDVVTLTYKNIFCDAPFRITEIKETEHGEYTIKGRQYNDTIYNDSLGATITTYNYATTKPSFGSPLPPSNLRVTVLQDIIEYPITKLNARITWSESITNQNVTYNVYRKYDNEWEFLGNTTAPCYVVQEAQDTVVSYGVVTVSGAGISSKRVATNFITLHLNDEPPAKPSNISISTSGADVTATWNMNDEPDFDHYTVEFWGKTYITKQPHFTGKGRDGANTIKVTAYDLGGNGASVSKSFTMLIKPADIMFVAASKGNGFITLSWPESEGATYYTITGATNLIVNTPVANIPISKTGTLTFYVRACNDYDTSQAYKVDVTVSTTETAAGKLILTKDLMEGITLGANTEMVFEDDANIIIKKGV